MKKCPYCENTGADNETYCCKCGNLMYDEPTSMQQASNASSYTYNTVNPTDGIGKKKKSINDYFVYYWNFLSSWSFHTSYRLFIILSSLSSTN